MMSFSKRSKKRVSFHPFIANGRYRLWEDSRICHSRYWKEVTCKGFWNDEEEDLQRSNPILKNKHAR